MCVFSTMQDNSRYTVATLDLPIKVYEAKRGMRKHLVHELETNFNWANFQLDKSYIIRNSSPPLLADKDWQTPWYDAGWSK